MKNYVKPSAEVVKLRQEEGIACTGSGDHCGKHGGGKPDDGKHNGGIKFDFLIFWCG